jgi:hypothetical protein
MNRDPEAVNQCLKILYEIYFRLQTNSGNVFFFPKALAMRIEDVLIKTDKLDKPIKEKSQDTELLEALEFVIDDWKQNFRFHETASYEMALEAIKNARGK